MEHLEDIADHVCRLIGDKAEGGCRVTRTTYGLTRFANSHIHQHHGENTTAVGVRIALDGRVASATTTGFDEDGLNRLVDTTMAAARLQPIDPHWPGVNGPTGPVARDQVDPSSIATDPGARADKVADFVAAGEDLEGAGFLDTSLTEMAVATTGGLMVSGRSTRSTLDGIHQSGVSAGSGHQTDIAFAAIDGAAAGARAARLANRGRGPEDVDPGGYEVVLSPECVATIATFLAAYGFGARSHIDGQSFVELGTAQFDPSFQLTDDPGDPRAVALGFDAEGTPKRRVALVEDGVSRAFAHDRRTAFRLGEESTGHALPRVAFGPIPINLIVGGGHTAVEDMVAGVERGIYVTTFNYCRILDPRTQVVTGLTRNGTFLIEGGKITRSLSNLRFTQSFVDALGAGAILALGDDQRHADSEFGPGFVIAPSIRLTSWNFTGGAQG